MGKDAVLRLKNTILFKTLLLKETEENDDNFLSSKVVNIVSVVSSLLDRIPENLPEYTLHDPNHSAKVVENMGKLIPEECLGNLNSIELSLLILSGYLHDIGMTCSPDEKEIIITTSEDFEILFKSDNDKYEKFKSFKDLSDHRSATFLEDQVFTEYLRRKHVNRSAEYIKSNLSVGELILSFQEIPFWKHLVTVCNGHGEPVSSLYNTSIYPRHTLIADRIINVQYLSLILRLADILDLDPERTPKVIYEFVNPKNPISILEWKKHRSLIGYSIKSDKVLFEAECSSPEVQRALEEFMDWIELERRETIALLKSYNDDISKKYYLNLNDSIVKDRIRSDGSYISNDLKFQIDYKKVMDLLMGEKLYKNSTVALRELLQNSNDAIKIRESIYKKKGDFFKPIITLKLIDDILSITDNGVGMDIDVFKGYFLQIGKSFYSSSAFYAKFSDVDVTSEFGIGVLSTFMVANSISVESRREPDNPLQPPEPILFEIPTAFSYTTQRKSARMEVGTTVTLKLKSNNPFKNKDFRSIIEQIIPNPPYTIEIHDSNGSYQYNGIVETEIPLMVFSNIDLNDSLEKYLVKEFSSNYTAFTHKILDISFKNNNDDISTLNDIEGTLSITNTAVMNYYSQLNGYLAQRNFKIGIPEIQPIDNKFSIRVSDTLKTLFPDWSSYYSNINLTKSACLSLTPDRTDVIVDERFKRLKREIEIKIIKELQNHFNEIIDRHSKETFYAYSDFLIATGYIGMDLNQKNSIFSKESASFFSEYLYLPILSDKGKIERIKISEIALSPTIGYVNSSWNETYIQETLEIIRTQNIKLILLPKLQFGISEHRIERFISALLGNQGKLLEPHTMLINCMPSFEIELFKVNNVYKLKGNHGDYDNISKSILESGNQILLMPRQSIEIYPTFNASHPLISVLLDDTGKYKNGDAADLRTKLASSVSDELSSSLNKLAKVDQDFLNKAVSYGVTSWNYKNYFDLTTSIFIKDPELLVSLNKIFESYWNEAKQLNLIEKEAEIPKITTSDFLNYWST